ncbi:amidohydrolase [Ilumatobacter nonamiensis]|uniref:amidohydrolase n=1 Tax=Ilumatobacter nonamiensis TaxID=467093 RepID=UPI0003451278|nr:amidohydrolase [Ilumatobacter nonamiensis]
MADTTVYTARRIVTLDPSQAIVEAVAVRDGRILAAGSLDECMSWGPHDIDERFADLVLVPGMIEAHAHSFEGAFARLPYVGWFDRHRLGGTVRGIRTYGELIERISEIDAEMRDSGAADSDPLVAIGFDPIYFRDEERLTRHHLDQVDTDRPVFLFHASGHLATVNSAMLAAHDITRDSTTVGVARDADGEPNGELQEIPAISLASSALMQILRAMNDPASIETLGQICANQGVTMLADLAAAGLQRPESQQLWHDTVDRADYPARILQRHIAALPPGATDWTEAAEQIVALGEADTDKLRTAGLKVLLDGSIQGFTAKMGWPGYYTGIDHGVWMTAPEQLLDLCRPFHERGINIHTHCNGDLTIDLWIDTVEQLILEHPWLDHRHTVQHCQLTTAAQYRRMAKLGICANIFTNHIWYWGDQHHDLTVGPERARRMEACRTAEREGVSFSMHSDASVTPLGQLHTMWCAVNRVTPSGRVLGPDERISAESALRAVTLGAAYQLHLDHEFGSIECGKAADFTVLAEDPLEVDPMTIKDIDVWGTVVGGQPHPANS